MANELEILSAGAVKPGLIRVIEAFGRDMGADVKVSFATAPAILKQIGAGEVIDIVIAPPHVIDELAITGKISPAERIILGRIGVGVLVRDGETLPKITVVDEFKQSLLSAESVIYNQASTGTYLEALFDRLGIGREIKAKSTRYPDFAAVLDHVSKGNGREIGLGATTVIIENERNGVKFAGPLPSEIQNYTAYVAAVMANSAGHENAQEFLSYLASPTGKSLFVAAGIQ
jgi:molybdate transport system substrate-binding protein